LALGVGPPSASRAEDDAAPAAPAADAKAAAKDAEPTTTKDPQIALDDLELLLAPMTKEETETEAKEKPLRSGLVRNVQHGPSAEQQAGRARADERGDDEEPELRDCARI
jgi:hypothetical protein